MVVTIRTWGWSPWERNQVTVFWLLVAALGHDVNHLGVNSQFLARLPNRENQVMLENNRNIYGK